MTPSKTAAELLAEFEPQIVTTTEYERQVWQARFSPCGEFLLAAGYDALVPRWKLEGNELTSLQPLAGHHGWVQCLDFADASKRLFTADSWGKLCCWDYESDKTEPAWAHEEAHDGWIRGLHCSPDGKLVATGGNDQMLRIWSVDDGEKAVELPHEQRIFSVCFHPDGKSVMTGDLKGVVRQWDLEKNQVVKQFDASLLYQLHRIQECGGARCLSFDSQGTRLLVAGQKTPQDGFATGIPCALLFDVESGELIQEMPVGTTNDGFIYDVGFHPEGFVMGTSSAFPGKGHLWFWMPEAEEAFLTSNKLSNGRSLSLHPDGQRMAMAISVSKNRNGRPEGEYEGGTAKIHLLTFGQPEPT